MMKKNVATESFYVWLVKYLKEIVFHVAIRKVVS